MVLLWGEDGVMIYNDAYSAFAGGRHPRLLGCKVREGWPEVADFNDNVMKVGLSGNTLAYKDQELTLHRHGRPEQVWMNLDYSPVLDESNRPAGVIAIVVETTERVRAERQIEAERGRLLSLFEQAPGFLAMFSGPDHVFALTNPAYQQLIGGREVIGKPIREALPEVERQGFPALLDDVYRSGKAHVGQAMPVSLNRGGEGEEIRFLDFVYQPVMDAGGRVTGILVEGYDITERAQAEQEVRRSEERFRALVNATSDVVYRMSPDWLEMRALDGRGFLADTDSPSVRWIDEYLLPEDQSAILAVIDEAIRSQGVFQLEHRVRQADGTVGWTFSRAIPLQDEDGKVTEWFGAASDITSRRKAEQHLRLVINELNHRVKNNLAMIQAIAAQTFRTAEDLDKAQASLLTRISALAQANDLLTGERGAEVQMRAVIEQAVRPHCPAQDQIRIAGPDLPLSPKTALSLSLAMHELSTNALKYGAWSRPEGVVRIRWSVYRPNDGARRLELTWAEQGGPEVSPPTRRGFGSRLVERGLAAEMGGEVRMRFEPEGLVCVIDAPLTVYVEEGAA
jgi:PAS domain S-box-containing protein